ncbi:MAG TPA: VOC family protein [Nitrososphaeraceae archaeon]|nr:VOC family protein [Nitrososphaeraceae archaeon]HSF51113.1 VOC family protein [Nitrososphaeraceae archaeon]
MSNQYDDKEIKEKIKISTIVHFEIPADDVERARKFYSTLFGWKIEKIEVKKAGETMDYWMISTSSNKGNSSEKSFHLDGGLIKRQHTQQPNLNYISVPSIDEYSNKVKELGGKVVLPKTEITDYGFFAVCMDTENNAFALWESKK